MGSDPRVASLHCYPIKSCRGVELREGTVQRRGFPLDRRFMVVDVNGTFRSQRRDPALARVDVSIGDGSLRVGADGHGSFDVDLDGAGGGEVVATTIWRHEGRSIDQGSEPADFFSDLLGSPSRLVYMADDEVRPVNPEHAASRDDIVGFADGYPFLLTSTASLEDLQSSMREPVPMDRFRANVVISGAEPWSEDTWRTLRVGAAELRFTRACTRCAITTTDQRTGERLAEPLATLGRLRRTPDGVTFGVYFAPASVGSEIRVGDALDVLESRND